MHIYPAGRYWYIYTPGFDFTPVPKVDLLVAVAVHNIRVDNAVRFKNKL